MKISKNCSKGLLVLLIYFISSIVVTLPFIIFNINTSSSPLMLRIIYLLASEIVMLSLIIYVLKDQIKDNLFDYKKNFKMYFSKYFKYWFLLIGIMMFSNMIILSITNGTQASNQEAINTLFNQSPAYTFFSAVFIAPITEELVFRLGIKNIVKDEKLFIVISGLVFGGLHVILSMKTPLELLYLIPYCTPGFIFAYLLVKSKNIFVPTFMHMFHNGIILSLQIVALLLKWVNLKKQLL